MTSHLGTAGICPTGCGRTVRLGHLMCGPCWSMVPGHLQREVHRTWRGFSRGNDEMFEAYEAACESAIASVP
jgi:hypothetical protein